MAFVVILLYFMYEILMEPQRLPLLNWGKERKKFYSLCDREIFYHLAISGQIVNCVLWHINNTCLGGGVERFTVRGQHVAKLLGRRGTVLTGYFDTVEFGQSFTVTYTLSGYITSVTIRTDSPRGTVVHVAYRSAHARLQRHRLKWHSKEPASYSDTFLMSHLVIYMIKLFVTVRGQVCICSKIRSNKIRYETNRTLVLRCPLYLWKQYWNQPRGFL